MADIGQSDRLHGYNELFRKETIGTNSRFPSFEDTPSGRPGKFKNGVVEGTDPLLLDHQGHIVPQNMLSAVLKPQAQWLFEKKSAGVDAATTLLHKEYPNVGYDKLGAYIKETLMKKGGAKPVFNTAKNPIVKSVLQARFHRTTPLT